MNWIILTMLAALLWAITNVVDKFVMAKVKIHSLVPLFIANILNLTVSLGLLAYFRPAINQWLALALLIGTVYPTSLFLYFNALKYEEVSRIMPWFGLETALVALGGIFLFHEQLILNQLLGIGLIILGVILLSIKEDKKITWRKWLNLFEFSADRKKIWMLLIGGSVLLMTIATLAEKKITLNIPALELFMMMQFGAALGFLPYFFIYQKQILQSFNEHRPKIFWLIGLSEGINVLAILAFFGALSLGPVSLVSSLGSVQYLFVLTITAIITVLKPKIIKESLEVKIVLLKTLCILLIIVGAFLIT